MCTARSFDANFDCERIFLIVLLPKIFEKQVSLTFVESSKTFLGGCTKYT